MHSTHSAFVVFISKMFQKASKTNSLQAYFTAYADYCKLEVCFLSLVHFIFKSFANYCGFVLNIYVCIYVNRQMFLISLIFYLLMQCRENGQKTLQLCNCCLCPELFFVDNVL